VIHIVLVEPEIPPNTGNVIRLCANSGAVLHLVKPLGFRLDDKSLRRSGLDYHDLADLHVHADLQQCLQVLAGARLFAVETQARLCYAEHDYREGDAFLFGSETKGLPQQVLERIGLDNSLYLPMRPGSRSLNLSNSVAIVAFEAWRRLGFSGADRHAERRQPE
jgi:tRNA (cytidine/uridine-2'-O-)-methyltransferase